MGDVAAEQFQQFVASRGDRLFRVTLALTGRHHAAEDLLQEALARTFVRWRQVRGDPETYVRRVMYNARASAWRRVRGREVLFDDVPERGQSGDDTGTVDSRLMVRQALMKLGPRQRAVLVARYFEDLSDVETAALLSCSASTVRSQTHRALARLREVAPELKDHHVLREGLR